MKMNKIFKKVAVLSVGLTMAIGAAVALNVGSKASEAKADDHVFYKLDGTQTGGSAGYDVESSITQGGIEWGVFGNTTMNPWRIGGKSLDGVDRTASSKTAMSKTTTKVELEIGTSNLTVNSLTLIVDDNADFASPIETVSGTFAASSTITFTATEDWTNCYYRFVFNVSVAGNSNKFLQFKTANFYEDASSAVPTVDFGSDSVNVTTVAPAELSFAFDSLTADATISQSSANGGEVELSLDGTNFASSLTVSKSLESPQTITLKGKSVGTVTLTAVSSGAESDTCTINVAEATTYEKITKVAEIKDGGSFIIAASSSPETVMSTTQNSNNRGLTKITYYNSNLYLASFDDAAVITIAKGTGDYAEYYTLYDASKEGYLYSENNQNYLKTSATISEYSYWSISFDSGNAVITNKGNTRIMRYNSNNKVFAVYASGQNPIALYELGTDIPKPTPLTSISGSPASVIEGGALTYVGSYAPSNATETISATISPDVAELGAPSMANGVLRINITGKAVEEDTEADLTLTGENGTVSTVIKITVKNYVASHTLVTDKAVLANGSKVVIASNDENYNLTAAAHAGGTSISTVETSFDRANGTLAASAATQEFTVWCVDSENGYYVFSDGGYFLCANTSKGNYLKRTDVLSNLCYFVIENGENGVVVKSQYAIEKEWNDNPADGYSIGLNKSSSLISLYAAFSSSIASTTLYISNESVDTIEGFISAFMHFGNVSKSTASDTGACKDDGKHYFDDAKTAFNSMSYDDRYAFVTEAEYADAYARLSAWADANNGTFNASYELESINNDVYSNTNNGSLILVIAIISGVSLVALSSLLILKKKRK